MNSEIISNLDIIYDNIQTICANNSIKSDNIKVLAVTKTIAPNIINQLDDRIIGIAENRAQELIVKYLQLVNKDNIQFIGQLQSNKVKYIIDKVSMIQSLDHISLAKAIDKHSGILGTKMPVLIQINSTSDPNRGGVNLESASDFIDQLSYFDNISIQGLMTVAPNTHDIKVIAQCFEKMYNLFDTLKLISQKNCNFKWLSMGMSGDYQIAIKSGSNMIRLGSAIFGHRT